MKRLLMIAFHFPPLAGSSGIQRTLSFARYLPQFGWEPLILTCNPRAYERTSDDLTLDTASIAVVKRAFALDSARHLGIRGRYAAFVARPDRWVTWWLGAVPAGLSMIRKYDPRAIWSTYPIATAHMIGHTLCRLSRLPWVADFRDPMAQEGYPADAKTRRRFKSIEEKALQRAARSVFVSPGAARHYYRQYPDVPRERIAVIENGYDEDSFARLDDDSSARLDEPAAPLVPGRLTLVHSGIVYPRERDPTQFFQALRQMLDERSLAPGELCVRLRAPVHDAFLNRLIDTYRLTQIVELAPPIPYRPALQEMLRADALLVLQARDCNEQIPAKVYEYLRCRRPIIGLTDPAGDTANLLRRSGVHAIARLDSAAEIAAELRRFLDQVKCHAALAADEAIVTAASRLNRTRELAHLLDGLSA